MKEDKLYTQEELERAINEALENYKKSFRFEEIKKQAFVNQRYHIVRIIDDDNVKKERNILARDYLLKHLIPLGDLYGFNVVNDYIMNIIEENEKNNKEEK